MPDYFIIIINPKNKIKLWLVLGRFFLFRAELKKVTSQAENPSAQAIAWSITTKCINQNINGIQIQVLNSDTVAVHLRAAALM